MSNKSTSSDKMSQVNANSFKSDFIYLEKMLLATDVNNRDLFYEYLSLEDFNDDIYNPKWLLSKYESNVWECHLRTKTNLILDFNIELEDGSLLSDVSNIMLLNGIKYFLCILSSKRYNGGKATKFCTFKRKFKNALILIDAILSRANKYELAKHRMSNFTRNDAIELFHDIYRGGGSLGAYNVINRVSSYLLVKSKLITDEQLYLCKSKYPTLFWKPEYPVLKLTNIDLYKSRLWLVENNFFRGKNSSASLITTKLYKEVFRNNLRVPTQSASFDELMLTLDFHTDTQFKAIPVVPNRDKFRSLTLSSISQYIFIFKLFSVCSSKDLLNIIDNSIFDIEANDITCIKNSSNPIGRYRTLPLSVVFKSIKNALEFYLNYSKDILNILELMVNNKDKLSVFSTSSSEVSSFILKNASPKLIDLGLIRYTIPSKKTKNKLHNEHYKNIKFNNGLVEIHEVLIGCVLIIIGAITARRQGEILDLDINCLTPNIEPNMGVGEFDEYSIIFENRKSGDSTDREKISRPIPKIVAKIIWDLSVFKRKLIANGFSIKDNNLLTCFGKTYIDEKEINIARANHCLDVFCDYFETTTIQTTNGVIQRFYIRQHQLRRFFAMTFFWGSGYDGLGTLGYYLGHTDPEHLYHYISENISGEVLKGVQAQRILYGLSSNDIDDLDSLRSILRSRFGVSDVEIRTLTEVIDYLEDEVKDGHITTAPSLLELKERIESNIYELLEEGFIDLQPRFLRVKDKLGGIIDKVHLSLIVKAV